MEIKIEMPNSLFLLHKTSYILKVLKKFGMYECKFFTLTLANHLLSKDQSHANDEEVE